MKHSRRMFLGSTVAAAGGGALFSFGNTPFSQITLAQSSGPDPLVAALQLQLKGGMEKLLQGKGEGARQFASTLRIYAAHAKGREAEWIARFRQLVADKGRAALVNAPVNHQEMERIADTLGVPVSMRPPHTPADPFRLEQALDLLLKEGIFPSIERAAVQLEQRGAQIDQRPPAQIALVVLRQDGFCASVCAGADALWHVSEVACAAAAALPLPLLIEACALASQACLALYAACLLCQIWM